MRTSCKKVTITGDKGNSRQSLGSADESAPLSELQPQNGESSRLNPHFFKLVESEPEKSLKKPEFNPNSIFFWKGEKSLSVPKKSFETSLNITIKNYSANCPVEEKLTLPVVGLIKCISRFSKIFSDIPIISESNKKERNREKTLREATF